MNQPRQKREALAAGELNWPKPALHARLLLALGVILCPAPLRADPLDTWETRHPLPAGRDYVYGGGRWMAVGHRLDPPNPFSGMILTSTNGSDWIIHDLDLDFDQNARLTAITHAAGQWIIAGRIHRYSLDNAAVWSSGDGEQYGVEQT